MTKSKWRVEWIGVLLVGISAANAQEGRRLERVWVQGEKVLLECRVIDVAPMDPETQQLPGQRAPSEEQREGDDPSRPFVDDRAFFNA